MHVLPPVCCGIDGHAAPLTACRRRVSEEGQLTTELGNWGTPSRARIALRTWWHAHQCPVGARERTGVYWQPVYPVLRDAVEGCVAHRHEVRQRPGHKTDQRDATWSAALLAQGLSTPRLVPPPASRA
jgi:hypothetical protein